MFLWHFLQYINVDIHHVLKSYFCNYWKGRLRDRSLFWLWLVLTERLERSTQFWWRRVLVGDVEDTTLHYTIFGVRIVCNILITRMKTKKHPFWRQHLAISQGFNYITLKLGWIKNRTTNQHPLVCGDFGSKADEGHCWSLMIFFDAVNVYHRCSYIVLGTNQCKLAQKCPRFDVIDVNFITVLVLVFQKTFFLCKSLVIGLVTKIKLKVLLTFIWRDEVTEPVIVTWCIFRKQRATIPRIFAIIDRHRSENKILVRDIIKIFCEGLDK